MVISNRIRPLASYDFCLETSMISIFLLIWLIVHILRIIFSTKCVCVCVCGQQVHSTLKMTMEPFSHTFKKMVYDGLR